MNYLIVGLGNPGTKYQLTRHNIGFLALDWLSKSLSTSPWRDEHKALTSQFQHDGKKILLAKPQTFMNLSGESVQSLLSFYKIPQTNMLVVQDELELPYGFFRFQSNRGHGGHNGIRSISGLLGNQNYTRLKLGVSRPPHPNMDVGDYLLQKFSEIELSELDLFLPKASEACLDWLKLGSDKVGNRYNGKGFRDLGS